MTAPRVLLLSGRFGKGHDVVAEACAAALAPYGVETKILDAIELLGGPGSAMGDRVFKTVLGIPAVYDAFHFSSLRGGGTLARTLDAASLRFAWPRLEAEVDAFPPDLVISVFATGAGAAARLRAARPSLRTVVVCTDSFAHSLWVHDETDLFLVTSRMAAASVRMHRPRARVEIIGAPVRPEFYAAPDRGAAREQLGIPGDAECALLMTGAWGVGPLAETAEALAAAGLWVLAVAGTNERTRSRLEALAAVQPRVIPFGFTDRVPELMAACDVVVSSSGDTCSEARVVRRGIVLLDVVPGHGRENVMHELEVGNSAVSTPDPAAVVASVQAFLDDSDRVAPDVPSLGEWQQQFRDALLGIGFAAG